MTEKERNLLIIACVTCVFVLGFMAGQWFGVLQLGSLFENQGLPGTTNLPSLEGAGQRAHINILAVTSQGGGEASKGWVELQQGKGRVLINTNPFVEPDTQYSLETAAHVAEGVTGKSLQNVDVIFTVEGSKANLVGGPSAGAAFTVATIAAMQGKQVREDAALTGTIDKSGQIGPIGGVLEKMVAFGELGASCSWCQKARAP